jgi:hypothetical protein
VSGAVGIGEAEGEAVPHVGDEAVAGAFGHQAPAQVVERLLALRRQAEVVEPAAPEHRNRALWHLDARHLERMQRGAGPEVDEGVAQALLLQVEGDPGPKTRS